MSHALIGHVFSDSGATKEFFGIFKLTQLVYIHRCLGIVHVNLDKIGLLIDFFLKCSIFCSVASVGD